VEGDHREAPQPPSGLGGPALDGEGLALVPLGAEASTGDRAARAAALRGPSRQEAGLIDDTSHAAAALAGPHPAPSDPAVVATVAVPEPEPQSAQASDVRRCLVYAAPEADAAACGNASLQNTPRRARGASERRCQRSRSRRRLQVAARVIAGIL